MSSKRRPSFFRSLFSIFGLRRPSHPPVAPHPLRYISRPDTALPPAYNQTWDTVQSQDIWPLFIREKKSNFKLHMRDKILNEPDWFLRLESYKDTASEVLWPNVIRLAREPDDNLKHWSLRFLRYARADNHQVPLPNVFAFMIVCEVIFTVLTPHPEDWPSGINAISRLTYYSDAAIMHWFSQRRHFESVSPESLESDKQMRTIVYRSSDARGQIRYHRIRKDALDYLQYFKKIGRSLYNGDAFFSWLNDDLGLMAQRRRKGRNFFPHPSYFAIHGIIVGPHNWTTDPLEELKSEIETRHRLRPEYANYERPFRRPNSVISNLRDPAYRVFVFDGGADVARYVDYWSRGNIPSSSSYRNITVRPWIG